MAKFDPSSAQPDVDTQPAAPAGFDPSTAEAVKPAGVIRRIADVSLVPLAQGVVGVPEAAVGIADLVTGGRAGKAAEAVGFRPREAKQIIGDALYSDEQQEANRKVAQAEGFLPTVQAAIENPSTIVRTAVESVPSMLLGGAVSRLALRAAPALNPITAGALGEGAVAAGQNAEQVRQEDPNGTLTPGQSLALATSGAVTGAISRLSGRVANRLGVGDVETALATGSMRPAVAQGAAKAAEKGIARKAAEGFLTEGVLEELPQSMQEQVFQNIAQGKPWDEGVGAAGAQGLLAGGLTGAAVGPFSRGEKQQEAAPKPLLLGYDRNADALIGFPDGTVARRSEVENYLKSLPPEQRADMLAKLQGYAPQPASAGDFTTSPGAAPASASTTAAGEVAAPNLETAPGAAPSRGGVAFQRDIPTGDLSLVDPEAEARARAATIDFQPQDLTPGWSTEAGAAPPAQPGMELPAPQFDTGRLAIAPEGPITRAARLALPAPGTVPPGQTISVDAQGNAGTTAQQDLRARETAPSGPQATGDWRNAARPNPNAGPISRAASLAPQAPQAAEGSSAAPTNAGTGNTSVPRGTGGFAPKPGDIVVDDHFHAAHAAATSPLNGRTEPTEGQKGAGNYAKGHVKVGGLDISIENPQGSMRRGKNADGTEWSNELTAHYGYIRRSEGADGDHVDVFIKPGTPRDFNGMVYVIDQIDPKTGRFDEHKVILGAANGPDAARLYRSNYSADWRGLGDMTAMPMAKFKEWVRSKDATKRPVGNILGATSRVRSAATPAPAPAPAAQAPAAEGNTSRTEAAATGRQTAAAAAYDRNPMLAFLAKYGLFHEKDSPKSLKREFSPDAQISVPGVHIATFRRDGLQLDALLPRAIEEGFLPPGADETQLHDLIAAAIRGERIIPAYAEGEAEREAERRMRAREQGQQPQHDEMTKSAAPAAASPQSASSPSEEAPAENGESAGERAETPPQPTAAPAPVASAAPAPTSDPGLRLGITPSDAEPVTVQNGVVHVGKYEAVNFDTGEPVRMPEGASSDDIKKALRDAGAVGRKAKFFGGVAPAGEQPQNAAPNTGTPRGAPSAQAPSAQDTGGKADNPRPGGNPAEAALNSTAAAAPVAPESGSQQASAAPQPEEADQQRQEAPPDGGKKAAAPAPAADKIDDFGEKIIGARKDYAALLKDAMDVDVGAAPLSKSWPEPDYGKLLEAGTDPWTVAFVHAARDSVPVKPQKAWKLKPWVEQVTQLRKFADELLSGRWKRDAIEPFITRGTLRDLGNTVELYQRLDHDISLKGVNVTSGSYSVYRGVPYSPPKTIWTVEQKAKATAFSNMPRELASGDTREQAIEAFIAKVKDNAASVEKAKKTATFDLWRENGKVHVGKKLGRQYVTLKVFDGPYAEAIKTARAYRDANLEELTQALEKYKSTPMERRAENQPRIGDDHRGGARVTPAVFGDTFGFRGVQFGNYVENDRRQQDLNDAYDALMDMAAVLGVPPRALSLDGKLGLAFGARGRGGKGAPAAHYESGQAVINLTKASGAGSLGHEWFHALDNYFGKLEGGAGGYQTVARNAKVRPEMQKAFDGIMAAIRSTGMLKRSLALDARKTKPYWSTNLELAARAYEAYLIAKLQDQGGQNDYLANVVGEDFWKAQDALLGHENEQTYPYPTAAEMGPIREAFDNFFRTVETRETDKGVGLFKIDNNTPMPSGLTMNQVRERLAEMRGMPIPKAQAIVDSITKDWKGGIEVKVVATPQDLPTRNPNPGTKGYYYNGVGYVVASKHKTAQDVGRTIAHEVIQHHGLRSVLGEDSWRRVMAQIQAAANAGNTELQEARDYVRKAYRTADDKYMLEEGGSLEADEVAARLIERSVDENGQMRPKLQWLKWVWSKIAGFLRHVGIKVPFTMSELHGIWVDARRAIETGRGTNPDLQVAMAARAAQEARSSFSDDPERWVLRTKEREKRGAGMVIGRSGPAMIEYVAADSSNPHAMPAFEAVDADGNVLARLEVLAEGGMGKGVIEVAPNRRRQGLATALYQAAEKHLGITMEPDRPHTPAAAAFWSQPNRPFGRNESESQSTKSDQSHEGLAAIDIAGDQGRQYTPEQLRAMRRVGFATEQVPLADRVRALWKDAGKKLAQGLVDQFAPIKDISKEAYGLLRLSKGASGAFEVLLHGGQLKLQDGVYDFDDAKKGGALDRLLVPLQGEHHDFLRWVAANRAEQLAKEDRENLFSAADIAALKTLADGELTQDFTLQHGPRKGQTTRSRAEAYRDSLATFNEFNKNTLDMAEQSGLIDGESRKYWEREFYVPFYRVEGEGGVRGMNVKSGVVRQQAFKQLKGGSQQLNSDLLENTLMNWAHLLDAAAKNRAAKATLEALENMGAAIEASEDDARQMARSMNARGNVVWFMDAGRKRHFLVDDPYLMTAVSALEFSGFNSPVMKALSGFKHALTVGVTASPFFKVRNLIRDSVQAIGTAPLGANPAANIAEGWRATAPGSADYFRLLAGGGTVHFGTMLEGSEARRVQKLVNQGVGRHTILDSAERVRDFYTRTLEPLIEAYNELGNRGEAVNRAALYQQLRRQGVSHAEASLQARDLMDFSMQGSFTTVRFLTQVVPFMNARMQGLYKLGRAAAEDPARFSAVLGATALLSIALLAAYSDDDDWKKREDWDRNNYWWFKAGGTAYRIPKPFEIGAMATLAERTWELSFEKEMTATRFRQQVVALMGDNLQMNPIPQLAKPLLNVYSNKDSFTGRPIESMGMEKLQPQFRFREDTSMAARALSSSHLLDVPAQLMGMEAFSPVQIDHLVRGYFGWLGSMIVGAGDVIARPATGQPAQPTPDYWKVLTGSMASRLEDAPSRYVSAVYDQARDLEQAYGTWRMLMREGKVQEAQAFRGEYEQELVRYRQVEAVKRAMSSINQLKHRVEQGDGTPDEKREALRSLNARADAVARRLAPI